MRQRRSGGCQNAGFDDAESIGAIESENQYIRIEIRASVTQPFHGMGIQARVSTRVEIYLISDITKMA